MDTLRRCCGVLVGCSNSIAAAPKIIIGVFYSRSGKCFAFYIWCCVFLQKKFRKNHCQTCQIIKNTRKKCNMANLIAFIWKSIKHLTQQIQTGDTLLNSFRKLEVLTSYLKIKLFLEYTHALNLLFCKSFNGIIILKQNLRIEY